MVEFKSCTVRVTYVFLCTHCQFVVAKTRLSFADCRLGLHCMLYLKMLALNGVCCILCQLLGFEVWLTGVKGLISSLSFVCLL